MSCRGVIDGRYLSVSVLDCAGQVRTYRGDQLGISEVDCPGPGGESCPICGRIEEPWRPGDAPELAPCELADDYSEYVYDPSPRAEFVNPVIRASLDRREV